MRILSDSDIDRAEWRRLVQSSATGTWFQTPEAYLLYASMPDLFRPFAIAVERVNELTNEGTLCGVCVGYVTVEKSAVKQFFTRRAIIIGGPALADDCTDAEVLALMEGVKTKTRHLQSLDSDLPETTHQSACIQASRQPENLSRVADEQQNASQKHAALTKNIKNTLRKLSPIYIETRNFNDYSKWRGAFESAGFAYQSHLNFHVDCVDKEAMDSQLSENRKRQIKKAIKSGVEIKSEGISEAEIREWYEILHALYKTKVKTPLFPLSFLLEFFRKELGRYLLVKYEGKVIGGIMCPIIESQEPRAESQEPRVGNKGVIYEWFECGMNADYKELYPSVMATYAGLSYACEYGIARYDMMGAGKPDVPYGVRDFKEEFGGTLVEHGRFLYVANPLLYLIGKIGVRILKNIG